MTNLSDFISFNSDFRDSVNLYLDLNKPEKINSYLPTKSSVDILQQYLDSVENNRQQATLLIGPYGKGKSHLLLLLLAILSLSKEDKGSVSLLNDLSKRISATSKETSKIIDGIVKKKTKYLPILIMSTQGDLNQAFMVGLNEALKREGLNELTPETYYTYAVATIDRWKEDYPETHKKYVDALKERKISEREMRTNLEGCDSNSLNIFKELYPEMTSGGIFNPLVNSEVLPMYQNVAYKLVEEYGYSGLYIVFDEFSKFIEGQEKQSTGNNMKLLQDICELANASKSTHVFFTMVAHKSIKEYGKYLSAEIINSFTGIEGRIKEIFFVTSTRNIYELVQSAIYKNGNLEEQPKYLQHISNEKTEDFYRFFAFSSVFTREDFEKMIVKGCYPLSPTSTYLLLNVSEKVAQNERTLFTFISKEDQYSMAKYVKSATERSGKEWVVNADLIYDYFQGLFKKDITNEFVHNEWLNAEYALERVSDSNQKKMIKTLAIINIVNKPEELSAEFDALRLASGVPDVDATINELVAKDLIYKKGSTNSFIFKTRATSKLKTEIKKRKDLKTSRANINKVLTEISDVQYVLPKRYNNEYTMTRYFRYEYMSVKEFLSINDLSVVLKDGKFCDGKFLALYKENDDDYSEVVLNKVKKAASGKIVVLLGDKSFQFLDQVQEYEVLQEIKSDAHFFVQEGYEVLNKEIPVIEEDLEREIYGFIDDNFGTKSDKTIFYYSNKKVNAVKENNLSVIADIICKEVYSKSISINHELINRETLTTPQIKKARKTIMEGFLSGTDTEQYMNGTSSEATIYRAVFVGTGIRDEKYKRNVSEVMDIFNEFISSAGDNKQSVKTLIDKLAVEPIAMRGAVIPLYLSYVLAQRNEDIVIYFGDKEVPLSADMILNMCDSPEDYQLFISLEDIKKEKYINLLSEMFIVQEKNKKTDSRIDNLVSGMQRWFRALPQVTKNVRKQSEYFQNEIIEKSVPRVRELMQSVEANPYEMLFINLPEIFNTDDDYEKLVENIAELKTKLNGYLDWLTNQAVERTIKVFDTKTKQNLYHTLQEWYQVQSEFAKRGLHSNKTTGLMRCIEENQSFNDADIVKKIIHVVTEMYIDTWNDTSMDNYIEELETVKSEIETLEDAGQNEYNCELRFINKNGEEVKRFYEPVSEGTGAILRNILADTLEDFNDLSVNDKIAILLEMIEKELG